VVGDVLASSLHSAIDTGSGAGDEIRMNWQGSGNEERILSAELEVPGPVLLDQVSHQIRIVDAGVM